MTFTPVPKPAKRERKPSKPVKRSRIKSGPSKAQDRAYLDWIKTQPCLAKRYAGFSDEINCRCYWPHRPTNEPAHVKTKGSGGADRGNTVPLCPLHHDEQEGDTEGFEAVYGVNLKLEAARLLVRYIEEGND